MNHIDRRRLAVYLIEQSKSIQRGLVWSTAFMAAGIIASIMFRDAWGGLVYLIGVTVAIVAGMSFVLNALRIRGIDRFQDDTDDKPKGQPRREAYMSQHRTQTVALYYADDATITISNQKLSRRQWRTLAETLSEGNWRWTRAQVARAKVITSITAPGVYRELTSNMEAVGVVRNGRVTDKGRDAICEAAGLDVVI